MKLKLIIFQFLLWCAIYQVQAQTPYIKEIKNTKNAVYLELGGTGIIYSVNYERMFLQNPKQKVSYRIGFMAVPAAIGIKSTTYWGTVIPIELNYMIPNQKGHHLGFGIGIANIFKYQAKYISSYDTISQTNVINGETINSTYQYLIFPRIGYQYQKNTPSWVFRFGIMPIFFNKSYLEYAPVWAGISLGRSF